MSVEKGVLGVSYPDCSNFCVPAHRSEGSWFPWPCLDLGLPLFGVPADRSEGFCFSLFRVLLEEDPL